MKSPRLFALERFQPTSANCGRCGAPADVGHSWRALNWQERLLWTEPESGKASDGRGSTLCDFVGCRRRDCAEHQPERQIRSQ